MKHFSLDIETLSTNANAVILSIGLYEMTEIQEELNPEQLFVTNIDIDSSLAAGLTVEGDTINWWLHQSDEARKALFTPEPVKLATALMDLTMWYANKTEFLNGDVPPQHRIYGHSTFDFPIVASSFKALGMPLPWSHRSLRDLRTLLDGKVTNDRKRGNAMEHSCGWDAFAQGQQVLEVLEIK